VRHVSLSNTSPRISLAGRFLMTAAASTSIALIRKHKTALERQANLDPHRYDTESQAEQGYIFRTVQKIRVTLKDFQATPISRSVRRSLNSRRGRSLAPRTNASRSEASALPDKMPGIGEVAWT
jgi:hypothetical protein